MGSSKKRNNRSNQEDKKLSLKDLPQWAEQNNIQIESLSHEYPQARTLKSEDVKSILSNNSPPMMYRAQITGLSRRTAKKACKKSQEQGCFIIQTAAEKPIARKKMKRKAKRA